MSQRKFTALLLLLMTVFSVQIQAQTNIESSTLTTDNTPQWAKDLRRWEIVTFGSFPFSMFVTTFTMDMFRWSKANGLDFSDAGRRYAPWPLKSAGAIAMESSEQELTITIAAGLSVVVACADLIIVQVKRYKARKKAEALPSGSVIINRRPWGEEPPLDQPDPEIPADDTVTDEIEPEPEFAVQP